MGGMLGLGTCTDGDHRSVFCGVSVIGRQGAICWGRGPLCSAFWHISGCYKVQTEAAVWQEVHHPPLQAKLSSPFSSNRQI